MSNTTTHILFDFFGTLVDYSPQPIAQGYVATFSLLEQQGYVGDYETFVKTWSRTYDELEADAKSSHQEFSMHQLASRVLDVTAGIEDQPLAAKLASTYLNEWNVSVSYLDGLAAMISRLANHYTVGIITNTHDTELVPGHLHAMKISEHFDIVVASVSFGLRKPNRAIFDHTLDELGVNGEQCVYIGDNYEADYCGSRAAGIRSLLIDPHRKHQIPEVDRLNSVLALEQHLVDKRHAR